MYHIFMAAEIHLCGKRNKYSQNGSTKHACLSKWRLVSVHVIPRPHAEVEPFFRQLQKSNGQVVRAPSHMS